jgi:hypothetical protein
MSAMPLLLGCRADAQWRSTARHYRLSTARSMRPHLGMNGIELGIELLLDNLKFTEPYRKNTEVTQANTISGMVSAGPAGT